MDHFNLTLREIMNTKLYVANLPTEVTETELKDLFSPSGVVSSVSIATDRTTQAQRGFAFVEMGNEAEATAAIAAVHGTPLRGNALTVNVSTPKPQTPAKN
jgi:cold-inducible RNA-binding protein